MRAAPFVPYHSFTFNIFQEEQNRGKPNWEHLNDELHVLITVEDSENRAQLKLERAVDEVKKLLTVVSKSDIRKIGRAFYMWQLYTIPHRHELSTCPANVTNKLWGNLFDCYQGIMEGGLCFKQELHCTDTATGWRLTTELLIITLHLPVRWLERLSLRLRHSLSKECANNEVRMLQVGR